MKVACYFTGRSVFGGAERRIGRIMNGVAKQGIDIEFVFTLFEPLEIIKAAFINAIGEPCSIDFKGFDNGWDVAKHIIREKFDVVFYVGAYRKMLPFFLGAKYAKSKTVLLQVSTGPSVGQFGSFLEKIEFQFVARNSDQIDCLYPSTTGSFQNKYRKQIVTTTPCPATDLNRFVPSCKEKKIVFISRWVKGKNVELFVESVLLIEDYLFDNGYKVLLCGKSQDGSIETAVERQLQKAKHPELVIMPGFINSEEILPNAEVFMSLQNINNYPSQSLLEAIACGCYIIASDEGDTRLLVKPEFGVCCGLTTNAIANCIRAYIEKSTSEKKQIIYNGRSFAEKTFDIRKSIDHYTRIITDRS